MSRRRSPTLSYVVRWRCPITGQRLRVWGGFAAVEVVCNRLKRRGVEHRWGTVRPTNVR